MVRLLCPHRAEGKKGQTCFDMTEEQQDVHLCPLVTERQKEYTSSCGLF